MLYRFVLISVLATAAAAQEPASGLMTQYGQWMLMAHGNAFLVQTIQHGPRTGDKLFSTNWAMVTGDRPLYGGNLELRGMLSLEPLTIGKSGYPEPFQVGEGLVDRQHPHDLFMELSAKWSNDFGFIYAAPVGDPALGPVAFPHRASAAEIPQATLGHHIEDSTHIASSVVTIGGKRGPYGLEFSGFHGREPDNNRWDIDRGNIDSWAIRGTWDVSPAVSAQVSTGHLNRPEADDPENLQRTTASVSYSAGGMSSSAIAGWNHFASHDEEALTLESVMQFNMSNYVTGRLEVLHRGLTITALTGGYTKDIYKTNDWLGGVGANVTVAHGDGDRPVSAFLFVRLRTRGMSMSHSMPHSMHEPMPAMHGGH